MPAQKRRGPTMVRKAEVERVLTAVNTEVEDLRGQVENSGAVIDRLAESHQALLGSVMPFVGVPQAYLGVERQVVVAFVPDDGNSVLQVTHLPVVFARHLRDQLTTAIDMDDDFLAHVENEAMARRAAESLTNITLVR